MPRAGRARRATWSWNRCWPLRAPRWSTYPTRAPRRPCRTCWAARWTAASWPAPRSSPHVQSGKLIALATSGKTRSALAPELPTIAESGFPEFDGTFWILLAAPKGVPPAVQKRFVDAMNEAIRAPEQKERAKALDIEMVGSTVAEAQARAKGQSAQWAALVKRIHLTND